MGEKLRNARGYAEVVVDNERAHALSSKWTTKNTVFFAHIKSRKWLHRSIFLGLCIVTLIFLKNPPVILIIGTLIGLTLANPEPKLSKKIANFLLGLSIAGIGLSLSLASVVSSLHHGWIIATMIGLTLILGAIVAKFLKLEKKSALLISCGTAICGGSAIMATSKAINASDDETVVSLATIFILNAIALVCLPFIGQHFDLSQTAFGTWAALAIHDTGSVMAATMEYGAVALEKGTAVKVLRALFIVPLVIGVSLSVADSAKSDSRLGVFSKMPWFIPAFFVGVMLANFFPLIQSHGAEFMRVSKISMLAALLLMGTSFNLRSFQAVGIKAFLAGVCIWIPVAIISFFAATL